MANRYLKHYGIKGMKWGVRRFQDSSGRLTAAGKERYKNKNKIDSVEKSGMIAEIGVAALFMLLPAFTTFGLVKASDFLEKRGHEKAVRITEEESVKNRSDLKMKTSVTTIEQDVKDTNPNFHKSKIYKFNCTRSTVAYEFRRRGYDVEATPSRIGDVIRDPYLSFKGYKGKDLSYSRDMAKRILQEADSWGSGSRGILEVTYYGGTMGHILNIEVGPKGAQFVDGQIGKTFTLDKNSSMWSSAHFGRVDNLDFTDHALNHVTNKKR